jgi:cyclopropane fatty-acyl-phospholipid synthase-like methyltransferase
VVSDARTERFWWNSLEGLEVDLNTAGHPAYNAVEAADFILGAIRPFSNFSRLLDLGCGIGRLTSEIARRVPDETEIVGVDISEKMIGEAKRWPEHNTLYRVNDGRTLPERSGAFDGAWSVAMFQHIPREAMMGYINEVYDHLRPGATFVFTVARGDEDMFLNHQLTDDGLVSLISKVGGRFTTVDVHQDDSNNWTWIEATK